MKQAKQNFIKATELSPDWLLALSRLASTYLWLYEDEKANKIWDDIKSMDPDNAWIFSDLGYNYYSLNRIEEAEQMFLKSLEIDPNYVYALRYLGIIYFRNHNDYETSFMYFNKVIELNPSDYWAYLNLAEMYQNAMQYQDAEIVLLDGLEKQTYKLQYYQNLGYLYLLMNKYDQSLAAFEKIIEIDPMNAIGYINLSYYHYLNNTNDTDTIFYYMSMGLNHGYYDYNWISTNFPTLADTYEFQNLMQTYFPDRN